MLNVGILGNYNEISYEIIKTLNNKNIKTFDFLNSKERCDILIFDCFYEKIKNIFISSANINYLIINKDNFKNINIYSNSPIYAISYGFNKKSNITVSSIDNKKIILYLQNKICSLKGSFIDVQEILYKENENNIYASMATICLMLIAELI